MGFWNRLQRECDVVETCLRLSGGKNTSDQQYRQAIACILEEMPVSARYYDLMKATCRRLMSHDIMTPLEIKQKLTINLIRISKAYGKNWMHPVKCFTSGNALDSFNAQLDDRLSMVCGSSGPLEFGHLLDILSLLVIHKAITKWNKVKADRREKIKKCRHYTYKALCAILVIVIMMLLSTTAYFYEDSRAAVLVVFIFLTYRLMVRRKK